MSVLKTVTDWLWKASLNVCVKSLRRFTQGELQSRFTMLTEQQSDWVSEERVCVCAGHLGHLWALPPLPLVVVLQWSLSAFRFMTALPSLGPALTAHTWFTPATSHNSRLTGVNLVNLYLSPGPPSVQSLGSHSLALFSYLTFVLISDLSVWFGLYVRHGVAMFFFIWSEIFSSAQTRNQDATDPNDWLNDSSAQSYEGCGLMFVPFSPHNFSSSS